MTRVDTHTAVDPDPEDLDLFRRSISLLEERILSAPWGRSLEGAILDALRRVPRHLFVHPANRAMAYADVALPTLAGMTTTAPSLVGYMIHLAAVRRGDRVLEIGTGTGYQAAVLAALGARVVTIECSAALAAAAGRMLGRSVALYLGNGAVGFPAGAPYHAILVAAAARDTASLRALTAQLSPGGGRLVAPVGAGHDQELVVLTRRGDEVRTAVAEGITVEFVRLVGSAPMPSSHVANACRASPRTQILKPGSEAHEH